MVLEVVLKTWGRVKVRVLNAWTFQWTRLLEHAVLNIASDTAGGSDLMRSCEHEIKPAQVI